MILCHVDKAGGDASSIFSIRSCFNGGSSETALRVDETSSIPIFLLLPLGAGSNAVRQYVTVRVTTCRTWTLPPWLTGSLLDSRGEYDALHGAALSGVDEYGDGTDCAEASAGENGDCGIRSRLGVRADLGAGFAKGDGGIMSRGDCGLDPLEAALLMETMVFSVDVDSEELLRESEGCDDSYEVFRETAGWDVVGGLVDGFAPVTSTRLSRDLSKLLSKPLSLKLNRVLVAEAGLITAGDMFLRKSRYADGGVMGVLRESSLFMKPGEGAMGLNISEGKVPDPGVCRDDAALALLSNPAAIIVAVAVAEAMIACRCLQERVTEESNE